MRREISVRELEARLQAGQPTYLLDVRQPWEAEIAALPRSVLIPLGQLPSRLDELDPPEDALVVVYCHHGIRSLTGAAILAGAGVAEAVSLAGGIEEWSRAIDPEVPRY